MFCPNDTWISAQLPDLKKFGGGAVPPPPPADMPMVGTHRDDKLLEQHCYKSAAGLLQLVRFYVCTAYRVSKKKRYGNSTGCRAS